MAKKDSKAVDEVTTAELPDDKDELDAAGETENLPDDTVCWETIDEITTADLLDDMERALTLLCLTPEKLKSEVMALTHRFIDDETDEALERIEFRVQDDEEEKPECLLLRDVSIFCWALSEVSRAHGWYVAPKLSVEILPCRKEGDNDNQG